MMIPLQQSQMQTVLLYRAMRTEYFPVSRTAELPDSYARGREYAIPAQTV